MAQRAKQLFESSEVPEKRQLLKYLLQNPTVKDKKLVFTLRKPFDLIASVDGQPIGLPQLDAFKTLDYRNIHRELQFLPCNFS